MEKLLSFDLLSAGISEEIWTWWQSEQSLETTQIQILEVRKGMESIIFTASFKKKQPTIWLLLDIKLLKQLLTDYLSVFIQSWEKSSGTFRFILCMSCEFTETEHSKTWWISLLPAIDSTIGFFLLFVGEPTSLFLKVSCYL